MTDRKIWIGLMGGLVLAIGFVPGFWNQFPKFRINGRTDLAQSVARLTPDDDSDVRYAGTVVSIPERDVEMSDQLFLKGSESEQEDRMKRLKLVKAELQLSVLKSEKAQQAAQAAVNQAKAHALGAHIICTSQDNPRFK